jgi:hypothetical protein
MYTGPRMSFELDRVGVCAPLEWSDVPNVVWHLHAWRGCAEQPGQCDYTDEIKGKACTAPRSRGSTTIVLEYEQAANKAAK